MSLKNELKDVANCTITTDCAVEPKSGSNAPKQKKKEAENQVLYINRI
jgi:hypothetical protein